MASVFVDVAGEWKLGGVEYLKPVEPAPNSVEPDLPRLPVLQVYEPPEGRKFDKANKKIEKWYLIKNNGFITDSKKITSYY